MGLRLTSFVIRIYLDVESSNGGCGLVSWGFVGDLAVLLIYDKGHLGGPPSDLLTNKFPRTRESVRGGARREEAARREVEPLKIITVSAPGRKTHVRCGIKL